MTGEEQKEQNKKREQFHPHPTPPVLNRTWPRGQGGFDAPLRAVSVRVNTPRVNVCLLMMLDAIRNRLTSNYMNKQRGESFKSGNVVIAKSSKSQSGDLSYKMHHMASKYK